MILNQKAPSQRLGQRLGWIDSAKGIGIVLVVVGHAWRGLQTSGLINDPALYHAIDSTIYSFHMPFFFFLSGILIERALLGSSAAAFVVSRVQRLIWPLALWTWVFFLFKGLAGSLANKPSDWAEFPILPLPPLEHFWFLWALFVIQLSLLLVRPLLKNSDPLQRGWILLWLASVALYLAGPDLGGCRSGLVRPSPMHRSFCWARRPLASGSAAPRSGLACWPLRLFLQLLLLPSPCRPPTGRGWWLAAGPRFCCASR